MRGLQRYFPTLAASALVVFLAFRNLLTDGGFSLEDRYVLGAAVANAILSWWVPNMSGSVAKYSKLVCNAALIGLAFFLKAQTGDGVISPTEWMDGVALLAAALGVAILPGPVHVRPFEVERPVLR